MNHIEAQIDEYVAGIESLVNQIAEIGSMYRLTTAEIRLIHVTRSMLGGLKDERRQNQELLKEHGLTGMPLEPRGSTGFASCDTPEGEAQ